jgi:hypothetical protein
MYIDVYQNRRGQTLAAPYSIRPRDGAPVSAPLSWDELGPGLSPAQFTIKTMRDRLDRVGDLWPGVLGPGIDMATSLVALQDVWAEEQGSALQHTQASEGSGGNVLPTPRKVGVVQPRQQPAHLKRSSLNCCSIGWLEAIPKLRGV